MAARRPDLKAGGAWYGRVVGDPTPLAPKNPVDVAAELKVPVLGLYGGKDQGIPVATLDAMKEALKKAGHTQSAFEIYPNSGHAFHADYRPSYNAEDAKDAWKKLLAFFKKQGLA